MAVEVHQRDEVAAPERRRSRRRVAIALVGVLAVAFAVRAHFAIDPSTGHQSADERAYVVVAWNVAHGNGYGPRGRGALHWPPGAPIAFSLAERVDPGPLDLEGGIPLAHWLQALAGTATVLAVFGIAALIAGGGAGLIAASVAALYPPLVAATGDLLSEPLGACLLALTVLALCWALRGRRRVAYAGAGVLLGLTILTRADFLLLIALLPLVVLVTQARWLGVRPALVRGALLGAMALLTVLPWTIYATNRAGHLVTVTTGDGPELFVGTCLPCDGNTTGMKRRYAAEAAAWANDPRMARLPTAEQSAYVVLSYIASRHPSPNRNGALRAAALDNLKYDLQHPVAYAGMTARKLYTLWLRPSRQGAPNRPEWVVPLHILVVLAGLLGLVAGIVRTRAPGLWAIAWILLYATALHVFLVSTARYNLPLVPLLIAGGAAGGTLAWRARTVRTAREAPGANSAPMAVEVRPSASG